MKLRLTASVLLAALLAVPGCNDDDGMGEIRHRLEADPRIEGVVVDGYWENDLPFLDSHNTHTATFHLAGRPEARVWIFYPHEEMFSDASPLRIGALGSHVLRAGKHGANDGFPDLSHAGPFAADMPVKIRRLDDLITHYDEVEAWVAAWPERGNPAGAATADRPRHFRTEATSSDAPYTPFADGVP